MFDTRIERINKRIAVNTERNRYRRRGRGVRGGDGAGRGERGRGEALTEGRGGRVGGEG